VITLAVVAPVVTYCLLISSDFPPFVDLGAFIMVCTPGGIGSNLLAIALNASAEMNAMLTLTSLLSGLFMLPLVFEVAVPALLDQPADGLLSPIPTLRSHLISIFIPLPLGFLVSHHFPGVRQPVRAAIGPAGASLVLVMAVLQMPNFLLAMQAMPPRSILLLCSLFTTQFFFAHLLGGIMGQPKDIRKSMALESGVHDVPLAAALILTCFDGLPATIVTPAVSIVYILGFTVSLPGSIIVLVLTAQTWRNEKAWRDAHNAYTLPSPLILGLKWVDVGNVRPPEGREIKNPRLEHVLPFRREFTVAEWVGFGVQDLQENDFIQSGEAYFKFEVGEEATAQRSSTFGMLFPSFDVCGLRGRRQAGKTQPMTLL